MVPLKSSSLVNPPPSAPTAYTLRAWLPGVRSAKPRRLPSGLHVGESGQHCGTRPQGIATVIALPADRTGLITRSRTVGAPPLFDESPSTEATSSPFGEISTPRYRCTSPAGAASAVSAASHHSPIPMQSIAAAITNLISFP